MPEPRTWYEIKALADGSAEILIYDEIVSPIEAAWFGGQSAKSFAADLKKLGDVKTLMIRINSPGGDVFEGNAIYNQLKTHKAKKTVYVDGIAASIASVIAMAGDEIIMPENAMMMIHDPSGLCWGTAVDLRKLADTLEKIKDSITTVYASRTGLGAEDIKALMSEETWMTAEEAVAQGFADQQAEAVEIAAIMRPHITSKFRRIPERIAALWTGPTNRQPPTAEREGVMPEAKVITIENLATDHPAIADHYRKEGEKAGLTAERARVTAILTLSGEMGLAELGPKLVDAGASIEEAEKTLKMRKLGQIESAAPESSGGGSGDAGNGLPALDSLTGEARWTAEWDRNHDGVHEEFGREGKAAFLAYKRAEANGQAKILKK